mgnify:FL=1
MIVEIIINTNVKTLNKTFDYNVPDNLEPKLGDRVYVHFGNKKKLDEGIIIGFKEKSEYKLKDIVKIQKDNISENRIKLAKWMSNRYFCNFSECLKLMLPPGTANKEETKRVKEKTINIYTLSKTIAEIETDIENKIIRGAKQIEVLRMMYDNQSLRLQDIEVMTNASSSTIKTLVEKGYIKQSEKQIERNTFLEKEIIKSSELKLNIEQQDAYYSIDKPGEYLLHGITGSGKTEIYLQLIKRELEKGKTAIVLVPEISLTPQTIDRFTSRFGKEKIAVLHSKLSNGERFDQWNKIKAGKAQIVIGARSAIFAPIKDLGIIIIDEEHDSSYQSESTPQYDALEIARKISQEENIILVLGSATPDTRTYKNALDGKVKLIELTKRANNATLPKVEIIDLRDELANNNHNMISQKLKKEIQTNLENKNQTILFLNRRGFSNFIMCKTCGNVIKCKRCDISMTYHKDEQKLKCHYCGLEELLPNKCPSCDGTDLKYSGSGTQKLEEEVHKLFPEATTIRMDIDTVTKKHSHEDILTKFKDDKIDILIGTQMIVKGHDFPKVTLVGVISADNALNIGDYRASEITFQVLTQVAGRAGRGDKNGKVIIQTYNPDHYAIECAKEQDFKKFYQIESKIRKTLKYPPFCDIIVLDFSSLNKVEIQRDTKKLHQYLKNKIINEKFGVLLYSPLPCPVEKINDRYRWRIIIKCIYDEKMNELLKQTLEEFYKFKTNTRLSIKQNPNNMA